MSVRGRFTKELGIKDFTPKDWGHISSGIQSVDLETGGGFPKGKVTEIYGPEAAAKTTLCFAAIAEVQRNGGEVVFIDVENAISRNWAEMHNINLEKMIVLQPDSAQDALEAVKISCEEGVDLVVLDSIAGMATERELAGELGDANVGDKARLLSQFFRQIPKAANKSGTTLIFINQLRHKIGVMFGSPETTPGGLGLKYAASLRLDTRKRERIPKDAKKPGLGNRFEVKVVKNKTGRPFGVAEYVILVDSGIDYIGDMLSACDETTVVMKKGSHYTNSLTGEKMANGKDAAVEWLKDNPEEYESIKKAMKETA
jgi:recombination protein RecA